MTIFSIAGVQFAGPIADNLQTMGDEVAKTKLRFPMGSNDNVWGTVCLGTAAEPGAIDARSGRKLFLWSCPKA